MSRDLNDIAAIEKAISKKYGKETVQDPRSNWSEEKEAEYIEQVKIAQSKQQQRDRQRERVEIDGVFVSRKLLNKERSLRTCPICGDYSFKTEDGVYMSKYECCVECYYLYIDGREERWTNGWRPTKEIKKNG
jgi:hypothetical protein